MQQSIDFKPANSSLMSEALQRALSDSAQVTNRARKDIPTILPILRLRGEPMIFPNTINIVKGKKGSHKSRFAEAIASAFLGCGRPVSAYDMVAEMHKEFSILYIDTERNQNDQLPFALRSIKRRLNHPFHEDLPHFQLLSLINVSRGKRTDVITEWLTHKRSEMTGHLIIICDVVTDCTWSFNDVSESLSFIDLINRQVNQQDCTFVAVIHQNPGRESAKSRGHIGTELENKASGVFVTSIQDSHVVFKTEKIRTGPPLPPLCLRWEDDIDDLAPMDYCIDQQNGRTKKIQNAAQYLSYEDGISKEELRDAIAERDAIEKDSARKKISRWLRDEIAVLVDDLYYLNNDLTAHG